MISIPLLVISSLIPLIVFLVLSVHHLITQKGENMKTLKFPPICSKWCSTFKHLKRLYLSDLEITHICHKCITWEVPRPSKLKPAANQLKFPIDE